MIKKLVKDINNIIIKDKSIKNLSTLLKEFKMDDIDNKIEEKTYVRELLYQNKNLNYELLLLHWDKDSETPIHKHPENGCLLKVLKGGLIEYKYKFGKFIEGNKLIENDVSYIDNLEGSHKIIANERSLSLHLYSPINYYCKN